jgi:hypothetical protein
VGYLPKLAYEHQVWNMSQSYENICSHYIGQTMMAKQLTSDEIDRIKQYHASTTNEGIVLDQINTTIYWEK